MTTVHDRIATGPGQEKTVSVTELLRAASEGDQEAWEEIVRRYHNLVWARVRACRLQHADACDAVQMTWLRLAENCHKIQSPEHLGGWLTTTAYRECLRILRRPTHLSYVADAVAEPADPGAGPEARVIEANTEADTARMLRILLDDLPPRWRILLEELFTDEPPPYDKVAATIGIPRGSIGPTRARALQRLRRMSDEHGLTESRWGWEEPGRPRSSSQLGRI
ncbi:MAG TPA: sigma-70 family RNA polymerase sigma factor [Mycobacteriales bacterium]|nr:sigma-70 family RNA polymerase sigma factor [Mycobacteriales bacterium]